MHHWLTLYDTGLRLSGAPLPGTDWLALVDPTRAGLSFWFDKRSASIQQALKSVTPMIQTYQCNPKMMYYPLEHPKQNPIPQQEPGLHHLRSPANSHRRVTPLIGGLGSLSEIQRNSVTIGPGEFVIEVPVEKTFPVAVGQIVSTDERHLTTAC